MQYNYPATDQPCYVDPNSSGSAPDGPGMNYDGSVQVDTNSQEPPYVAPLPFHIPPPVPGADYTHMNEMPQLVAIALQHRCESQAKLTEGVEGDNTVQSHFHSCRVPGISIWDYIRRVAKYSYCSPECFIVGYIYLDRYCYNTNSVLSFTNIHRLIITVVLLSAKLRDDFFYSNAYYAKIGGVVNSELNNLELEMLKQICWNAWVEPSVFQMYYNMLMNAYGHLITVETT